MWRRVSKIIVGPLTALLIGFSPSISYSQPAGDFDVIAQFSDSRVSLTLATHSQPSTDNRRPLGITIGLFGLESVASSARPAFVYEIGEWNQILDLWTRAKEIKSDTWQIVGSVAQTGAYASTLTIGGGPGVIVSIDDPAQGTLTMVLSKSEFDRFHTALLQQRDVLLGLGKNFQALQDASKAADDATKSVEESLRRSQELSDEMQKNLDQAEQTRRNLDQLRNLQLPAR